MTTTQTFSGLPAGDPPQGTDSIPIARSGSNYQITPAGLASYVSSSGNVVSQIVAGSNVTISPSGGTGVVTINATGGGGGGGTVTSVSGTGTVNGLTLSGTVTSSGSLTLGGALSGVNLASQVTGTLPVVNGGTGTTTPSLVAGTNVSISGTWPNQTINSSGGGGGSPGGSSGQLQFNNSGAFGGASIYYAAPAYGSGNNIQVGIGQAANTSWSGNSYFPASILQVGSTAAIWSGYYGGPNNTHFTNNIYYDNTYWRFINTGGGTLLNMNNGTCTFYVMPNGSAGEIASISAAMVISNDGGVQVGAPTGGDKGLGTLNATGLYVNGVAVSTGGGGGSPGGASLTLQYNNSGSFAGASLAQGADGGVYNTTFGQDHGTGSLTVGRYYYSGSEDAYGGAIFMSCVSGDVWGGTVGGQDKTVGLENKWNGGGGTMMFTVSSFSTPVASIQVDGSLFSGGGLPTAPFGVDATSTGYVVAQNGVYVGVPNSGTNTGLLKLANASTPYVITLNAGSTAADYQFVLPTTAGSAGQVLTNNGSGVTTWATPTGGASSGALLANTTETSGTVQTIAVSTATGGSPTYTSGPVAIIVPYITGSGSSNSPIFDTNSYYNNSNPSRFTVSVSGIYLLTGGYRWVPTTATGAFLSESYFAVNGDYFHVSAIFPYGYLSNITTSSHVNLGSAIVQLNAGDYVEMIATFEGNTSGDVLVEATQYFGISLLGG